MGRSVWCNPRFFVYASGNIINNLGNALYALALPLLIYELTRSPIDMSLMVACETVPLIFAPLIGTVVDRVSCRNAIFATLFFQSLCSALIPFLHVAGLLQIWMLYVLGGLLALGGLTLRTAQFVVVPYMFPEQRLDASAALTTGFTITSIFGPFLAGALLAATDFYMLLWINALTFFGPILLHAYTKIPNEKKGDAGHSIQQIWSDMREGLIYLQQDRLLFRLLFILAIATFGSSGLITVVLFHLKHVLLLPDRLVGYVLIANGVGGFVGTLIPRRLERVAKPKLLTVLYLLNAGGLLLFLIPAWWFVPIALFAASIGSIAAAVSVNLLLTEEVPQQLLGRVSASIRMLMSLAAPLSPLVFGYVAGKYGTVVAFVWMAVVFTVAMLLALTVKERAKMTREDACSYDR